MISRLGQWKQALPGMKWPSERLGAGWRVRNRPGGVGWTQVWGTQGDRDECKPGMLRDKKRITV